MDIENQVQSLFDLQQLDKDIIACQKKFDALPQRQKILEAREKRTQLLEKLGKVDEMLKVADKAVTAIVDEDERLAKRQEEIQHDIDEAGNDFRNMEARTKELAGQTRRREELVEKLEKAEGDKAKVVEVKQNLEGAIAKLDKIEESAIASFREEGGALKNELARLAEQRKGYAQAIDADLFARYEKTAKACGGIALARLEETKCGACRVAFDTGRLREIKKQAPFATCPHCRRILVIA